MVLDTHIWHWWVNQIPGRLSKAERYQVEIADLTRFIPVTPQIAVTAVALPEHHKDPQDRIIIATALQYQARLMSFDQQFPKYRESDGLLEGAGRV